jgi:hypothetical protein
MVPGPALSGGRSKLPAIETRNVSACAALVPQQAGPRRHGRFTEAN